MKHSLVIIPTYNELENIARIIPEVLKQDPGMEVLVVDDNSPDGTAHVVETMAQSEPRIHLLKRMGKAGLGTAYVAGFRYALEHGFDFIFEMDADFSHNPNDLPRLLAKADECDLVIGSRYCSGINVVNWPMRRLILSYSASMYTRFITGLPIRDTTAGFKCYRRAALESLKLDAIKSNGYSFQIETNFITWKKGFRLGEVPIIFIDRRAGVSKMSKHIVYEAIFMVWKLKFLSIFCKSSF
jgi:dolichol-phosphate mannosyltransferase